MLLSTALFVSCKKEENPDTGKGEIYYLYENGELNKSNFIQLKDGKWSDDDNENGTYVVSGTSITIYVEMMGEKEEYAKGTLKDGVLTLTIMGTKITYCKEGKTPSVTPSTPDEPEPGKQDEAVITAIKGAEINGTSIFMLVGKTTDSVSLSNKVTCSEGSVWKLYYDKLGQMEIPTKIAAGQSGELNDGDNIFYIVVTSGDSTKVNVYEIKIHRQYEIFVNYYDGETLLDTEEVTSGNTFDARYIPKIAGYTFNYWKNSKNQKYSESVLYESISLYADKSANKYTVSLDVNGGNELFKSNAQVTYNGAFKFEVPTRPGYTFSGWHVRYNQSKEEQLTNEKGNSLSAWNIPEDVTVKAGWTANEYNVTLNVGDTNAGTVSGAGTYKYDGDVRITAQTKNGYVWLGWYDENNRLVSDKSSYNFTMGFDVTYTAKWSKLAITQNIFEAGVVTSNDKYILGQELKISATTYLGYDFVGWYCNDTLIADSCEYTFRTSANNETYTAKWKIKDEFKNFKFSSNLKFCEIEGVYDKTVTEVVIPDYVTGIGDYAFRDCRGLTSITIPDSVTSIGIGAFENCSGLTSVIWNAENCTKAGSSYNPIFGNSNNLTAVTIGDNVKTIPSYAFYNCSGLTSIVIPDSVTSIGSSVFKGCSGLTIVTLPFIGAELNRTESAHFGYIFGANSYSNNSQYVPSDLKTVVISNNSGVTSIGDYAFNDCSGLTSITIPNNVTSIGIGAFYNCSGLTSITIPDSVTSIGDRAFYGCSGLTSVTIGNSVTSIGNYAFSGCSRLTRVTIPDSVTSIGEGAFVLCSGLTSVTIGNSVTSIGYWSFRDCSGLTSVTIGNSVTFIGHEAFGYCGRLKYNEYDNGLYLGNGSNPYLVLIKAKSTDITSCVINEGCKVVADSAFNRCESLTSVTIGNSVTSIGDMAFDGCSGLTSVTIPDSVTSIGGGAFRDCRGLTSITIPDSVTSIGGSAFYCCSGLTSVTIGNSVTSIGGYAFYYCRGLTSITIPDSVTSIGDRAFDGCSGLTSVTIGNSVTSIGNYAFSNCSGLQEIHFNGTIAQWKKISKDSSWAYKVPWSCKVICTDGETSL